mmetsp:Transcript_9375/g.22229  ORF Transcript_9375/g.22229 Transcript_9375/m.22229 type:complete len:579 (+) Transcript_9375:2049-3785(+)
MWERGNSMKAGRQRDRQRKRERERAMADGEPSHPTLSRQDSCADDFECALCHDLFLEPCVLSCGHAFCKDCLANCIEQLERQNNRCPICRRIFNLFSRRDLSVCRPFEKLLQEQFPNEYAERKRERDQITAPATPASPASSASPSPSPPSSLNAASAGAEVAAAAAGPAAGPATPSPSPGVPGVAGVAGSPGGSSPAALGPEFLPLFVLEPLLPRQRMALHIFEYRYRSMVRDVMGGRCHFGMLSGRTSGIVTGADFPVGMKGVEVEITECMPLPDGRFNIAIEARRMFKIVGMRPDPPPNANRNSTMLPLPYSVAQVEWVNLAENDRRDRFPTIFRTHLNELQAVGIEDDELRSPGDNRLQARVFADTLDHLLPRWKDLVQGTALEPGPSGSRRGARERQDAAEAAEAAGGEAVPRRGRSYERTPGQLAAVMEQLGPIPPVGLPSDRAMWIAALINPLPGLGICDEIRPQMLQAPHALERAQILHMTLIRSIEKMEAMNESMVLYFVKSIIYGFMAPFLHILGPKPSAVFLSALAVISAVGLNVLLSKYMPAGGVEGRQWWYENWHIKDRVIEPWIR